MSPIGTGLKVKLGGKHLAIAGDGEDKSTETSLRLQYPYDCHQHHCTKFPGFCRNDDCKQRLGTREAALGDQYSTLDASIWTPLEKEIKDLEKEIKTRWRETPNDEDEILHLGCYSMACDCLSCRVETLRLKLRASQMRGAVWQGKATLLREYIEIRSTDEAEERRRLDATQSRLEVQIQKAVGTDSAAARSQEEQAGHDRDTENTKSSAAVYHYLPDDRKWCDPARWDEPDECICDLCKQKAKNEELAKELQRQQQALKNGGKSKQRASETRGKKSAPPASKLLLEEVGHESHFSRTNTYRGHGASALKPGARHLNSNKFKGIANDTEQASKKGKKAKRPALGR